MKVRRGPTLKGIQILIRTPRALTSIQPARGRDRFDQFEQLLKAAATLFSMLPRGARVKILQSSRGIKGWLGMGLRYSLLHSMQVTTEANVSVREDVHLHNVAGLTVGRNVSIHPMSYLDAAGGIVIGNDVSIAHGVTVMS